MTLNLVPRPPPWHLAGGSTSTHTRIGTTPLAPSCRLRRAPRAEVSPDSSAAVLLPSITLLRRLLAALVRRPEAPARLKHLESLSQVE